MLSILQGLKIYISNEPADMRKSIDGLASIIDEQGEDVGSGNLYLFFNRYKNRVKVLFWDRNGFVLYYKRLEKGKFQLKPLPDDAMEISKQQLTWLLAGLDFELMNKFPELNYDEYY